MCIFQCRQKDLHWFHIRSSGKRVVFRETFKAAPTDAQKAYDAILAYARKRPIIKTR